MMTDLITQRFVVNGQKCEIAQIIVELLATLEPIKDDFPEIEDLPPEPVDINLEEGEVTGEE